MYRISSFHYISLLPNIEPCSEASGQSRGLGPVIPGPLVSMVRKILLTSWVVTAWCFQIIAIPRKENKITVARSLTSCSRLLCVTLVARVSFPRSTVLHGDVLRWVERLIRPCLRKLVGRWVGQAVPQHSLQDNLDYSSERTRFPNRVVQGTPPGLSFPHKRLDEKWTARCFSTVISCVELSPPGSAAREKRPLRLVRVG